MRLLQEVAALLLWELEAVSKRKWSCLSKLKRKKAALASRLRRFDWSGGSSHRKALARILAKIDGYRRRLEERKLGYAPARVR